MYEVILDGLGDVRRTKEGSHGVGGRMEVRNMWIVCRREGCHQEAGSKSLEGRSGAWTLAHVSWKTGYRKPWLSPKDLGRWAG